MICRTSGHSLACAAALVLVVGLSKGGTARALDKTWNDGTADWTVVGDWTPSGVPGSMDNAVFRRGGGVVYTVTFPGSGAGGGAPAVNYLTDQLRVGNNTVTFADSVVANLTVPSTYTLNNATTAEVGRGIIIGELSTDTAAVLTTQLVKLEGVAATIGDASSSNGTLNVSAGTFNVTGSANPAFELLVGRSGTGTLNVTGGASVNVSGAFGDTMLAENFGSSGTAAIGGAGSNWTIGRNLTVGNSGIGTLNVTGGAQVTDLNGYVANNSTSTSTATVSGMNSTWTSSETELRIGVSGGGTLNVSSGGQVNCPSSYFGSDSAGSGTGSVTGAGSKLTTTGYMYVGYNGGGMLTASGGAQVSDRYGYVASEPMSTGTLTVDGIGTSWTSVLDIYVGNSGTGNLNVTGGAHVTNRNGFLGDLSSSSGSVSVSGSGSLWSNSGTLSIGAAGTGLVTVGSGATVSAAGPAPNVSIGSLGTVNGAGTISGSVQNGGTVAPGTSAGILTITGSYIQTPAGKLQIDIGGTTPGSDYDRLAVSGAVTLGGTLQVSLNPFAISLGNRFDIMDWGSRSGGFSTVTLPALSGTLGWGTSALYSAGVLSVIDTGYLPGDFDHEGHANAADIAACEGALKNLIAFQATLPGGGSLSGQRSVSIGDLTGDGLVNNADLQGLITYLANGGAIAAAQVAAVPEPRSLLLFATALGLTAVIGCQGRSLCPVIRLTARLIEQRFLEFREPWCGPRRLRSTETKCACQHGSTRRDNPYSIQTSMSHLQPSSIQERKCAGYSALRGCSSALRNSGLAGNIPPHPLRL
jgi:T5SS/PEP-CTERM-associated repeat protein